MIGALNKRIKSATGLDGFLLGEIWFRGIRIGSIWIGQLYFRKELEGGPIRIQHYSWGIWQRVEK